MKTTLRIIFSLILSLTAFVFAAAATSPGHVGSGTVPLGVAVMGTSGGNAAADTTSYILKEYEGYIAIYSSMFDNRPTTITNIEVKNLRKVDRDLLGQGIAAKSREEMMSLLEDLGS